MNAHTWIDRDLYPFRPHHLDTADGRMHYVDEGAGPVVLLVHGTPTWSFLFRGLISELSRDHRVIAPDHLGFGLSDKPADVPYRPEDHAARLSRFIERLGLEDITLVVHDFGGPIGLSYAVERPANVRALAIMNTWMWSLEGTTAARAGRFFSTPVGRVLYTRLNFSPRVMMPAAFADRTALTRQIHRHYLRPFGGRADRMAAWAFARALVASGEWYERVWQRRDRLAEKPTLLLWGMKDPGFGPAFLARWTEGLPAAHVMRCPDAGHFVPEEVDPSVLASAIRAHIAESPAHVSAESWVPNVRDETTTSVS
jgi:haloalkane dehalogenase